MDHKDFKTTVTRPFHIQSRLPSDEYRENFDKIDWGKKREAQDKPKAATGKG